MKKYLIRSDLLLGVDYLMTKNYYWGGITIGIIICVGILSGFTSFYSKNFSDDERKSPWIKLMHVFLLGPAYQIWKQLRSQTDIIILKEVMKIRFIEAALESAPQIFLQFHMLNICKRPEVSTPNENIFCEPIREQRIQEILIPVLSLHLSLLSFSWAITSQKKILQYEGNLNFLRIGYLFIMFLIQIFTRAYILLFIVNLIDVIWGVFGIIIGFGLPLLLHVLTICFFNRKKSKRDMFFSISKVFFYDLDDESRVFGIVNTVIHHLQYIGSLIAGYFMFKSVRGGNIKAYIAPYILISVSFLLNLLWINVIAPKSKENLKQNAYAKGTPDTTSYEYK